MDFDLAAWLPLLTPKAIDWAERCASEVLASGTPLDEQGIALARRVGVACPEKIRVSLVTRIPVPADDVLRQAALQAGFLGANTTGLTLGHAIYILHGHDSPTLLAHECRHVHQYEEAGSIAAYLPRYLRQVAQFGYAAAPYEVDARAHETSV